MQFNMNTATCTELCIMGKTCWPADLASLGSGQLALTCPDSSIAFKKNVSYKTTQKTTSTNTELQIPKTVKTSRIVLPSVVPTLVPSLYQRLLRLACAQGTVEGILRQVWLHVSVGRHERGHKARPEARAKPGIARPPTHQHDRKLWTPGCPPRPQEVLEIAGTCEVREPRRPRRRGSHLRLSLLKRKWRKARRHDLLLWRKLTNLPPWFG